MTDKVLIVLSCGTDNPNRTTRALFFAMVAKKGYTQEAVLRIPANMPYGHPPYHRWLPAHFL